MNAAAPAFPHGWVFIGERQWRSAWIGEIWLFAALFIVNGLTFSIFVGRMFDVSPFAMASPPNSCGDPRPGDVRSQSALAAAGREP